jgi:hypothetical protein
MHKNATKCNKTQSKWCINKHGASKIIDTFETYQHASGDPSQRRSSAASMDLRVGEAPMDCYPVDDISGKTNCEMHQSMKNISMKVAVGYVLPSGPGQVWHVREI